MSTACIVISDVSGEECAMNVVFDGGFDKSSPAHCAIRRVLEQIDSLGIEIREPIEQANALPAVPETMLLGADGRTLIQ